MINVAGRAYNKQLRDTFEFTSLVTVSSLGGDSPVGFQILDANKMKRLLHANLSRLKLVLAVTDELGENLVPKQSTAFTEQQGFVGDFD